MQRKRTLTVAVAALAWLSVATVLSARDAIAFRMSGGSMEPTIQPDAMLKIEQIPPNTMPTRGDVIAFRFPSDRTTFYIKRIIGYPADRVQLIGGVVHINGKPTQREPLPDYPTKNVDGGISQAKRWRETLPNGTAYEILDSGGPLDDTPVFNLGPNQYFVLGDNRDNSNDSRAPQVGLVLRENIFGRVTRP